jgi:RHS repeat-associated protein
VDGPLANDTVTYTYDELGRVLSRSIANFAVTYDYDLLGRIITETSAVGAFSYQYYGVTRRVRTVTYPNGQTSTYAYYANSGDHRLQEIHHRTSGGVTLSKFNYTYDSVGNIKTWTQQRDTNPSKAYDLEYDRADQLRSAVWRTTDPTPTILKRYAYSYDPAGNRTVEQIDNAPVLSAYDSMNRLTSQTPGGTMRFAGTLNEAATVTIEGAPATVTSDNRFTGGAQVGSGTSQVVVKAKDYAGNERTNTYEVNVSGSSTTFTYDANGNLTSDGTRTFEWDAENRLVRVLEDESTVSEFSYDGFGRRSEKIAAGVTRTFVYDMEAVVEERLSSGGTLKNIHGPGVDNHLAMLDASGVPSYHISDHLGSVVQSTDQTGQVTLAREYDAYGNLLQGDSQGGHAYTGREWDPEIALYYYRARFYDPSMGRFISEDPIGTKGGPNLYAYVAANPARHNDPTGLQGVRVPNSETPRYNCMAWGLGNSDTWIQPCVGGPNTIPPKFGCTEISCDDEVPCDRVKVMIFDEQDNPTNWHVVRKECGQDWTSKNGASSLYTGITDPQGFYDDHYEPKSPFTITCWSCPKGTGPMAQKPCY